MSRRATPSRVRSIPLVAGGLGLAAVLVLNLPGVADLRAWKSPATVLSHVAFVLIAWALSPRFPSRVSAIARLSTAQRLVALAAALAGPLIVIVAVHAAAPRYAHELFTREWGLVEPLQFVLWLTAAWLAFERARRGAPGSADHLTFRLAGWGAILLALEEVDYLGIVPAVARLAGVPAGRIGGRHIGGVHDVINALGQTWLVLGLLAILALLGLVLGWSAARGLHRVIWREVASPSAWPLAGTAIFLGVGQLADIDHPAVSAVFGQSSLWHDLREEPIELLAIICVNASLLAKLTDRWRVSD